MNADSPLPPYLPPARLAQERLLAKLQSLPIVKQRIIQDGSESLICQSSRSLAVSCTDSSHRPRLRDGDESKFILSLPKFDADSRGGLQDIITRLEQLGEMFQGEYGIVGGQTLGDFEANFSPC